MKFDRSKILIIHKGGRMHTWCDDLLAGFREIGCDAHVLALRDRSLTERVQQWQGGGKLWENKATVQRCTSLIAEFNPKLIVLLNFAGLPESTDQMLRKAAGSDVPIVGWLADHISQLPATAQPNLNGVMAFDSATLEVLESAYQNTGAKLDFLPLAVNPSRYPDYGKPWQMRQEGMVFVGNHTPTRRALIRQYREAGGTISAFGPGAETGHRFWRRRRFKPAEAARIYGSHQGVLNLLQSPNTVHGLNLRAYEVAASGGLGTYPYTPDLMLSFAPDQEIIAYHDLEDLARKTRTLFHESEQATRIIAAGKKRVLAEHTYAHRAMRLLTDWLPTP